MTIFFKGQIITMVQPVPAARESVQKLVGAVLSALEQSYPERFPK